MITSPSGAEKIQVLTGGPQHETMALAQFRDAAGYSKQSPLPPRKVTLQGIVKLAGTTVAVKTTGVIDGNQIGALAATDGLLNAAVAADGLPDGVTVIAVARDAVPGAPGAVVISTLPPYPPTTGVAQPVTFTLIVDRNSIIGLSSTDALNGAAVSGSGIPDGATVKSVTRAAVAPTNIQPGVPGEVLIALPPPKVEAPPPSAPLPAAPAPTPVPSSAPAPMGGPPSPVAVAPTPGPAVPTETPPPAAAVLTPVDLTFDIPVAPIVVADGVSRLILSPTEPLPALSVTTPPKPVDGQQLFIFCTREVGALSVLPNIGQVVNLVDADKTPVDAQPSDVPQNPPPPTTKLVGNTAIGFLYSASNATWDRIE
jgi:hypothetical protein